MIVYGAAGGLDLVSSASYFLNSERGPQAASFLPEQDKELHDGNSPGFRCVV